MKILLVLSFLLINYCCKAQQYSLTDFSLTKDLKYNSVLWKKLNASNNSFRVSIANGLLKVYVNKPTTVKMLQIPNGHFVALNSGEWIGSLFFKPTDTTKKVIFVNGSLAFLKHKAETFNLIISKNSLDADILSYKQAVISLGNTPDICPYNNNWLFVQHFSSSQQYGSLNQIYATQDTFLVTRNFIFKTLPYVVYVFNNKIFVATDSELYCLNTCFEEEYTLRNLFWKGLYPNSIAVIDLKHIYVGIRGGYAEVNVLENSIRFYAYKE